MEHRKQMNNETSSKELFLQNKLVENEKPAIYSLEAEFSKTRKNRDYKPYLIVFGFICLLILVTVATARYFEYKSKQVNIDISDFEDLRLKEALSAALEKERELNRKTEELEHLQSFFNQEVQSFKERMRQELEQKRNADQRTIQQLEKKEQDYLNDLKTEYEQQYIKKQAEIAKLQDRVKKEIEYSRISQESLETELQDQKEYYEKRISQLKEENSNLELYKYGLNAFLKDKQASGCVLDPRQRRNILIFINQYQKVPSETMVDLYRDENIYIGKLKLISDKNGIKAETVEVVPNQRIKPLDWFRLPK